MVKAPNPGPFTLDGTRTYLVGSRRVAVIDPGPLSPDHVTALVEAVGEAETAVILVTHAHQDHAAAAEPLALELDARVLGYSPGARPLEAGELVETDEGTLRPVETPGHAREHLVFYWDRGQAVFPGDLILGAGDTTWVGAYPGCVEDYLESLGKLEALEARIIYPAHGPPVREVSSALRRYREHRLERIRQVQEAREAAPGATPDELVQRIYGDQVPAELVQAARRSVKAILHYLDDES